MLEIIIFVVIMLLISNANKRTKRNAKPAPPPVYTPPLPRKSGPSREQVEKKVNQQIFGTEDPRDRVTIYNRLIRTDRYQDMEKIAHELGISKYKVLREIQDLQEKGHYPEVKVDAKNYKLIYPTPYRKAPAKAPAPVLEIPGNKKEKTAPLPEVQTPTKKQRNQDVRTFMEPSKPYRPDRSTAERYEDWMPVPDGKEVVRCSYCAAGNLISKHQKASRFTCYFCREELE